MLAMSGWAPKSRIIACTKGWARKMASASCRSRRRASARRSAGVSPQLGQGLLETLAAGLMLQGLAFDADAPYVSPAVLCGLRHELGLEEQLAGNAGQQSFLKYLACHAVPDVAQFGGQHPTCSGGRCLRCARCGRRRRAADFACCSGLHAGRRHFDHGQGQTGLCGIRRLRRRRTRRHGTGR